MITDEQLETLLLHKLFMRKCWGGKHTSFDNLKKGIKVGELGKEGLKRVTKIGRKMIKKGLLVTKPTHYGLQVSLNPKQSEIIISKIRKFFPENV